MTVRNLGGESYGRYVVVDHGGGYTSTIWDRIGSGRYVSDAYVYTGHDGYVPGVPPLLTRGSAERRTESRSSCSPGPPTPARRGCRPPGAGRIR